MVAAHPAYTVTYRGAGWWEGRESSHGPASQAAIFVRREEGEVGCREVVEEWKGWELVERIDYPVVREERRSREEVVGDETEFHLRTLAWDARVAGEEREDGAVEVTVDRLMEFDGVVELEVELEEVVAVLKSRGYMVDIERRLVVVEEGRKEDSEEDWDEEDE